MEIDNSLIFDSLLTLPDQCIYGLINEIDKKIYLGYSSNVTLALSKLIKEMKYSNHILNPDRKKLRFDIIETTHTAKELRFRLGYWINRYSNMGYTMYRKYSNITSYKLRVDLLADFRFRGGVRHLFYVKLINRRYKEIVVGVFEDLKDVESFIDNNYKKIESIVYATNKLTREFLGK